MTSYLRTEADVPAEPPDELRFRRRLGLRAKAKELWRSRELVRTLTEREIKARYKQAVFGFAWALITPLALMLVLTFVFRRVAQIDTGAIPYPVFAYLGLLPWTFFASSLSSGGISLVANVPLMNKVYCPREVFPMASVGVAVVDTVVALPNLLVLFLIYGVVPQAASVWVPLLLVVQVMFTLGIVFILSPIIVYVRDMRFVLPIILQLGLFATPVAYPINRIVPESLQGVYAAINPLAPVIAGYRRAVILGLPPRWGLLLVGAISSLVYLVLGYSLFKRVEAGFADVV